MHSTSCKVTQVRLGQNVGTSSHSPNVRRRKVAPAPFQVSVRGGVLGRWRFSTRAGTEREHGRAFLSRRSQPESQSAAESGRVHRARADRVEVADSGQEESAAVLEMLKGCGR